MPNGSNDLYNTIKAQEVNFPLPTPTATVKVGTFDAATGQFTYADGWQTTRQISSNPGAQQGQPTSTVAIGVESHVDAVRVTLIFEVINSLGDLTVDMPDLGKFKTTQTSLTVDVGTASAVPFSVSSGSKSWSPPSGSYDPHTHVLTEYLPPTIVRPPIIGAGAFTVPVLPVVIVYDPPADSQNKNIAMYQFVQTSGVTTTSAFSEQDSTTTPAPGGYTAAASLASLMTGAAKVLGLVPPSSPYSAYAKGAAAALNVIASGLGSETATQTEGTSTTTTDSLQITNVWGETISTEPGAGGPGKGDVMYFLMNARMVWLAQNGQLNLALLGWDRTASVTVEFLQQNGAGLDAGSIQALLNLDPLVSSPGGPLDPPRFVSIEITEMQGSDRPGYFYTHSVIQSDTSTTAHFTTNIIDDRAGWLSFLGIGPSQTQTTTSTVTQTISSTTTEGVAVTATVNFYATTGEFYAVSVYYDAVFGTFAFFSTPVASEPLISGTLRNALGQPEALQEVTLINKGRKYTTRTNEQGQYAFYSTTIEPGETSLQTGAVQNQFVFSGKPLQDLELRP